MKMVTIGSSEILCKNRLCELSLNDAERLCELSLPDPLDSIFRLRFINGSARLLATEKEIEEVLTALTPREVAEVSKFFRDVLQILSDVPQAADVPKDVLPDLFWGSFLLPFLTATRHFIPESLFDEDVSDVEILALKPHAEELFDFYRLRNYTKAASIINQVLKNPQRITLERFLKILFGLCPEKVRGGLIPSIGRN